jgi:hypothetical protein
MTAIELHTWVMEHITVYPFLSKEGKRINELALMDKINEFAREGAKGEQSHLAKGRAGEGTEGA